MRVEPIILSLRRDLAALSPSVSSLDAVRVGVERAPLRALALVGGTADRRVVEPFDPARTSAIGLALTEAGYAWRLDGGALSVFKPSLTGERREELRRASSRRAEEARIAVRLERARRLRAVPKERRAGAKREVGARTEAAIAEIDGALSDFLARVGG